MTIKQTYKYILFLFSLLLYILIQLTHPLAVAKDLSINQTEIPTRLVAESPTTNQTQEIIERCEALLKNPQKFDLATIHANLASAYNQVGQTSEAISHWQQAAALYQKADNKVKLAEVLIDQAQAYNSLGQFARAIPLLEKSISLIDKSDNRKAMATAWGVLGNSYSLSNKYDLALAAYQESLDSAKTLDPSYTVTPLNNQVAVWLKRANWYELQVKLAENEGEEEEQKRLLKLANLDLHNARIAANQALKASLGSNNLSEVKALLNLLRISPQNTQYQEQAISILTTLPDSRSKAYSLINLAAYQSGTAKVDSLKQASSISTTLGDWRTQSFALGDLGHFYEQQKDWQLAMKYTRTAIIAAQRIMAKDSLYKWHWQAGRIYTANNSTKEAIASYKEAVADLQSIRGDIASASKDLQFNVRDEIEPAYRQLIDLLLDSESKTSASEALEVADLLKLTELQNFFGDECLEVKTAFNSPTKTQSPNIAVIHSIILEEKTYVILEVGNKVTKHLIPINRISLENKIRNFRYLLETSSSTEYLPLSQELYNFLIQPIQPILEKVKPIELTFINDGILRNIPMAALYDGKHFLIEKYPISYSLSNKRSNKDMKTTQGALIFGLTVKTPSFPALPNVAIETQAIQKVTKGEKLLDKNFTKLNFERQIKDRDYSIVHIATHGKFKGTVNSSLLQAFDKPIYLQEFESIFGKTNSFIDLLTLSACQTAAGDNRSTLGIAGLAVRTGVRNVLSSLWYVNDADVVTLIEDFYNQIQKMEITKAEALRKAQVEAISTLTHPAVWSSFILING